MAPSPRLSPPALARHGPQAYSNNLVDHHLVLDLVPPLAHAYFSARLPAPLSYSQAAILACVGLQQHEIGKVRQAGGRIPAPALGGAPGRPGAYCLRRGWAGPLSPAWLRTGQELV